ncbi:MAG: sensor histidine kinase [Candidatus Angelobacter sp.]|nr:sensor histidine kinase [Candidatus Angelobacter sp.]
MADSDLIYQRLSRAVLEDPKAARSSFLELFESTSPHLEFVLLRAARPGESRVRQTIANAVRAHPDKSRIINHLFTWRNSEVDEFALRAIDAAIKDPDDRAPTSTRSRELGSTLKVSEIYRYLSERLRHKLRNAMLGAQNQSVEIRAAIGRGNLDVIPAHVAKLNDSMLLLGRLLEAVEVDPRYFELRPVSLSAWLAEMNKRYAGQYEQVGLELLGDIHVQITASDYLLETAFWNVWVNAQQAIGQNTNIIIRFTAYGEKIRLLIIDNGLGFPITLRDIAFSQTYSSKHTSRGRGLMETQDAIERLGGSVRLTEVAPAELRIEIKLPIRR